MKYLNLLCNTFELTCLFPDAKLLETDYVNNGFNTLKIQSGNNTIDINHYFDIDIFKKIEDLENVFEIDSLYVNPTENLTIICDRQLWYRFYFPLLKNQKEEFDKLEKIYVERNVEIFFNFAILEAVNYEDEEDYFLYDFKFKHIKISDYELFKGKNNFYYDSFYSLYHLLAEGQMNIVLYPNLKYGYGEYHIDFSKIFYNFNINNRLDRNNVYSHTCLKPRYHRIKFLLEAHKNDILKYGENNVNIQFIEEYKDATKNGFIHTDNTKKHTKNHINYFNKEFYEKFLNIIDKINVTPDNPDFLYDHLRNYFKYEEYNNSYIDVTGETHCIFDLKYGFFTEKSIKPILAEKFVMIYGSKKVYEEFKRIGIDLFLEDFNLKGIEDKNELEQIDMIISSIKKMNKDELKKLYIKKYDTIKRNKEKLFQYYCNIMNNVNVLLLRKKENKLL